MPGTCYRHVRHWAGFVGADLPVQISHAGKSTAMVSRRLRVAMITFGPQGDVQPMIALGAGLVRAGHQAVLLGDSGFAALSAEAGVEHVSLAGGGVRDLIDEAGYRALMERGLEARVLMRTVFGHVATHTEAWGRQFLMAAESADIILAAGPAFYVGLSVAEALRLPVVGVAFQPVTPTHAFPPTLMMSRWLPRASYRALHWLLLEVAWLLTARPTQRLRRSIGLPPWPPHGPALRLWHKRLPMMTAVSPILVPRPDDWPDFAHMTGAWFLDNASSYKPPTELAQFLQVGPPPVYIGFGSMSGFDGEATMGLLLGALGGRRAVVAAGWGGLTSAARPKELCLIDGAPHDWLLPQMVLAVHHGGAGTTHAVARAGIPQVIIPHLGDQPFWAARVHGLGAAPPAIERRTLSAGNLAAAIEIAESVPMQDAAARIAHRLREEDGVREAIRIIESVATCPAA